MVRSSARWFLLSLLVACGGSPPPPAQEPTPTGPAVDPFETMADFKQRICACTDKPCAQPLVKELTIWSNKPEANVAGDAERERMNTLAAETNECAKRALTNE